MPVLDGLGLVTELRRRGRRTPVIVAGGLLGEAETRALQGVEVNLFLHKPFSRSELFSVLRRALAGAGPRA